MCGWFGSWGGEAVEETRERLVSLKVSPRNLLVLQQELTASLFSPTPLFFLIPSLSYLSLYVCVRAFVLARACVCVIFFLFSLCVHSVSLFVICSFLFWISALFLGSLSVIFLFICLCSVITCVHCVSVFYTFVLFLYPAFFPAYLSFFLST